MAQLSHRFYLLIELEIIEVNIVKVHLRSTPKTLILFGWKFWVLKVVNRWRNCWIDFAFFVELEINAVKNKMVKVHIWLRPKTRILFGWKFGFLKVVHRWRNWCIDLAFFIELEINAVKTVKIYIYGRDLKRKYYLVENLGFKK